MSAYTVKQETCMRESAPATFEFLGIRCFHWRCGLPSLRRTDIIAAAITVKRRACRYKLLLYIATSNERWLETLCRRRQCFSHEAAAAQESGDFLLISVFRSYCTVQTYTKGDAQEVWLGTIRRPSLLNTRAILASQRQCACIYAYYYLN